MVAAIYCFFIRSPPSTIRNTIVDFLLSEAYVNSGGKLVSAHEATDGEIAVASSGPGSTIVEAAIDSNLRVFCSISPPARSSRNILTSGPSLAAQANDCGSSSGMVPRTTSTPHLCKKPCAANGNSTHAASAGHLVSPYKCHSVPSFRKSEVVNSSFFWGEEFKVIGRHQVDQFLLAHLEERKMVSV